MPESKPAAIGIVIHSWWKRWRGNFASTKYPVFTDALEVLDYTKKLGAAGLQIGVDKWTDDFAKQVATAREKLGLYLEGSITLPKEEAEVPHFEATIQRAKEAGATVFRTAVGGRRYELFKSYDEFTRFKQKAVRSMQLAAPIVEKQGVRIGVENHKDFHAAELLEILQKLGSSAFGACIDTGNSIALLEEPMQVVEILAPVAVTVHLKDMAVQPSPTGFLLSEVPLGEGMLDLQSMVDSVRAASPKASINLEMITRDPLSVPCLVPEYWGAFSGKPASDLAMALASVSHYASPKLPSVTGKSVDDVLKQEDDNIVASLRYAGQNLGGS